MARLGVVLSRFVLASLLSVVVLLVPNHAISQIDPGNGVPPLEATVHRDPRAVAVLNQCLNAAGGVQAISAIKDFTAIGTIAYNWGDQPARGSVTIKDRGLSEFRLDASLDDGVHSWMASDGKALEKRPDGASKQLPIQNALKPASVTFPLLQLVTDMADISTRISYVGLVHHKGQQVYDIRLQKIFPAHTDPLGLRSRVTKADLFIDPSTFLILSVQDMAYRRDNKPGESRHEMQFSGYQPINGILVPLAIKELIGKQETVSIQLSQITFNSGLTHADFTFLL